MGDWCSLKRGSFEMTKRYQPDIIQIGWEEVFVTMQLRKLDPVIIQALRKIFFAGAMFVALRNVDKEDVMRECASVLLKDDV